MNAIFQLIFGFFNKLGFLGTILTIVAIAACWFFGPWAIVWALNTLFSLSIAHTWQTWLAVVLLWQFFNGSSSSK